MGLLSSLRNGGSRPGAHRGMGEQFRERERDDDRAAAAAAAQAAAAAAGRRACWRRLRGLQGGQVLGVVLHGRRGRAESEPWTLGAAAAASEAWETGAFSPAPARPLRPVRLLLALGSDCGCEHARRLQWPAADSRGPAVLSPRLLFSFACMLRHLTRRYGRMGAEAGGALRKRGRAGRPLAGGRSASSPHEWIKRAATKMRAATKTGRASVQVCGKPWWLAGGAGAARVALRCGEAVLGPKGCC